MSKKVSIISAGDLAPLRDVDDCQESVNLVWDKFIASEIGIVNLELPLTESMERVDKAINLKADPSIAFSLKEVGIDVVSFANNHSLDYSNQGLTDTLSNLKNASVYSVGAGKNIDRAFEPVIQEIKGIKIAHIGICTALPTGFGANENKPGVASIRIKSSFYIDSVTLDEQPGMAPWVETAVVDEDLSYACKKIEEIKNKVDVLIAQVHWGVPHGWSALFQGPLAEYQQPLGHALIEAGVDIIMGHHPHVVHGVEKYQEGYIIYSLGNFLFHSMGEDHKAKLTMRYPPYNVESLEKGEAREAVLMETSINTSSKLSFKFYPITLNKFGEPEFIEDKRAKNVLERMKKQSNILGTEFKIKGVIGELS